MKEIYLEIDGKRIKLSEEQVKILNLDKQKNKNPFEKVEEESPYYVINILDNVIEWVNENVGSDKQAYSVANHFNDKDFAIKQAKEEVLNRLLKRFSYENGWTDDLWLDDDIPKFYIVYDTNRNQWLTRMTGGLKHLLMVHFTSDDIAQRAINEIIIPFYNNELEVCKIWE